MREYLFRCEDCQTVISSGRGDVRVIVCWACGGDAPLVVSFGQELTTEERETWYGPPDQTT